MRRRWQLRIIISLLASINIGRSSPVNWSSYRLRDIVRGLAVHQARRCHQKFPHSIASEYLRRRKNQTMDLPLICTIVHERAAKFGRTPSKNDLVVHIRLGDVAKSSGHEMWESGARIGLAMHEYVRPRSYYEHLALPAQSSVSSVVLISSDIHKNDGDYLHNTTTESRNGALYRAIVQEWFESKGYTVQERYNRLPDEDFVYMATAKMFVLGGGGFSYVASLCVEKEGGTVYGNTTSFRVPSPGGKTPVYGNKSVLEEVPPGDTSLVYRNKSIVQEAPLGGKTLVYGNKSVFQGAPPGDTSLVYRNTSMVQEKPLGEPARGDRSNY